MALPRRSPPHRPRLSKPKEYCNKACATKAAKRDAVCMQCNEYPQR